VPQVARSAVSALRGWSGEPQKSVEIRWIGIGVVRGWSPPRTGQVCERISAQTPWIHPESKIQSEIAIDTRRLASLATLATSCGRPREMKATRQSLGSHTSRWGIKFWRSVGKMFLLLVLPIVFRLPLI
jgi:hypothetical protein